jgi:hypothetical protein
MAALEGDLQGVLADQAHVMDAQLLCRQALDPRQAARRAGFPAALSAWARPPELLARISASVAALPLDLHHLALSIDVDIERERVGVLQLLPSLSER